MRKTLIIFTVIFFYLTSFFYSCNIKKDSSEDSLDVIKNIDSYSCDCIIKLKNESGLIEYNTIQHYKKKMGSIIELDKDRIFAYKNDKIYVKDLKNKSKYKLEKDFDEVFKLSILGEYIGLMYTNQDIKVNEKTVNGIEYDVVSLSIPGVNRNIRKGELYIDKKGKYPEGLKIFDERGKERITIQYKNFQGNIDIEDELFNID
ncbi:germination lipoprotein GerS-related protein [Clostridium tetani]|nr:germination lipoprotein GerS-related protein [Clostridium tetani]KGI36759.1 hypothetical protein LA33_13030 [Clostridium tetani ATCC 9441]KGI38666.1 hypothetical protein KY52_05890 [Clostridium tetani]KGI43281.1 hypothetical protein KY55_07500 [Clostridium tetani]KGI44091.1 hypothetical protein KY54_08510 [Clostridium tetani]KHO30984.1 hypothetical protein OR63_12715 [Clostridium tetani]